jgi:hypothetical protein
MKSIIRGTTTAGETAARMHPRMVASSQVRPRRGGATSRTPIISKTAGTLLMISAARPTRWRVSRRSSNPARRRITTRAICRKSPETCIISGDMRSHT